VKGAALELLGGEDAASIPIAFTEIVVHLAKDSGVTLTEADATVAAALRDALGARRGLLGEIERST
jgi:hypothetical protein